MPTPPELIRHLQNADRVVVLTGAGVSAESGVPTFRDAQTGLWADFRPEELATPDAFRRNPKLVWEWYAWRRELVAKVEPNAAHRALAAMQDKFERFTLVTQNVDGLHQRAGSRDVVELHGNIGRSKCFTEDSVVPVWSDAGEVPPRCPRCGGWLRPDVVWFGERLPDSAVKLALARSKDCDVFLAIGTSGVVFPAADLPLRALAAGAIVVEVNPATTALSPNAHYVLSAPAGEIVPQLLEAIQR